METGDGGLLAFVSHASDDQDMADWVGVVLTEKGIRTWVDSRELHLREDEELVSARIWDALGAATDFVLIASRTALVKPWVIHELQIASERWMGSGAPRIWILVSEGDGEMVEAPFLGVARCDKEGLCSLAARIIEIAAPAAEVAFDNTRVNRLRSQYLMGGSTAVQAVNAFDALLPTLIEQIDQMRTDGFEAVSARGLDWLKLLARLLDLRADQAWLCDTLEVACAKESPIRATLLNNLGTALVYRGLRDDADVALGKAARIWRKDEDWSGVAIALGNRALAALDDNDLSAAFRWVSKAEAALSMALKNGGLENRELRLEVLSTLGNLHNHRGRALARTGRDEEAYAAFADHLALAVATENRRATAVALGRMAWLDLRHGRTEVRTQLALDRYLTLSTALHNPRGASHARAWRGQHAILSGKLEWAATEFRAEIALRRYLASPLGLFRAYAWAALCWNRLGRTEEAEHFRSLAMTVVPLGFVDPRDHQLLRALQGEVVVKNEAWCHPALTLLLN